ncbi:MAG: hypothetical protein M1409_02670 [Actinobacteria bacterium]|nr:hypothetical protein [Actinomycetota bacterium]
MNELIQYLTNKGIVNPASKEKQINGGSDLSSYLRDDVKNIVFSSPHGITATEIANHFGFNSPEKNRIKNNDFSGYWGILGALDYLTGGYEGTYSKKKQKVIKIISTTVLPINPIFYPSD